MKLKIPRRVRGALYIITMIGTPLVAYLATKGIIGDIEVAFWSAEVTIVSAIAGLNLTPEEEL